MKVRTNIDPKPKKNKFLPEQKKYTGNFAPKGQKEEDRKAIYSNDAGEIQKLIKRKMTKKS